MWCGPLDRGRGFQWCLTAERHLEELLPLGGDVQDAGADAADFLKGELHLLEHAGATPGSAARTRIDDPVFDTEMTGP